MAYLAYAAAWIATASAVCIAIYFTHNANPLWAMIIPALISINNKKTKEDNTEEE